MFTSHGHHIPGSGTGNIFVLSTQCGGIHECNDCIREAAKVYAIAFHGSSNIVEQNQHMTHWFEYLNSLGFKGLLARRIYRETVRTKLEED